MSTTTIYVTGSRGFKSAVITKLGSNVSLGAQDVSEDLIRFSLPKNLMLESFKASIGNDILFDHDLLFFYESQDHALPRTRF